MQKIDIIHEPTNEEPFVIINKPSGMPSAPLDASDTDNALCHAAKYFPKILSVNGIKNIECGLLHRLDTVTSGLILIATTQEFYDFLQKEQKEGRFFKTYTAKSMYIKNNPEILEGFPVCNYINQFELFNSKTKDLNFCVESFFRAYGLGSKLVRPVTTDSGMAALKKCGKKIYSTNINVSFLCNDNNVSLFDVKCKISAGFRHQVRCHLAWVGLPIVGDNLYNSYEVQKPASEKKIEFVASSIEFTNPITNKRLVFEL